MFKKFFKWITISAVIFGTVVYYKTSAYITTYVSEVIQNMSNPPILAIVIDMGVFITNTFIFSIFGGFINTVLHF